MHEEDAGLGFVAQSPGDADEIAAHAAFSVVALRVRCVVAQHDQGQVAVPETDDPHERVDDTLRGGPGLGIERLAPADVLDLSVGAEHPPIGRDAFDFGFAETEMRDGPGPADCLLDGCGCPAKHVRLECGASTPGRVCPA